MSYTKSVQSCTKLIHSQCSGRSMANHFKVQVRESQAELEHRLERASTATSRERLQMLHWIETQATTTRQALAQRLGRDESSVYPWLQRYKQGGIERLLEVKTPSGKVAKFSGEAMEQLQARLTQPKGFKSYEQIQCWLQQHGIGWPTRQCIIWCATNSKPNSKCPVLTLPKQSQPCNRLSKKPLWHH